MRIIGLTGGIACGKSTLAAMLGALGASVIDADAVSRSLTAPGGAALPGVRQAFGAEVFHADGTLNRKALARKVFGSPQELQKLNAVTHPLILSAMEAQIDLCRKRGDPVVVLDVPLLFETGLDRLCHATVCAVADESTQLARLESRDGMAREQALARIRSQMPVKEKAARSNVTVDTQKPLSDLRTQMEQLYKSWLNA